MLGQAAREMATPTWAVENRTAVENRMEADGRSAAEDRSEGRSADWRTVDRALRTIARRRAALDAEEARWLREAEALQIWRPLGMVSMIDYLERVLGYAPRTAQDRLRVARALGSLPRLTAALASGELAYSAVRELTRVVTPSTEVAWVEAVQGKNLRQIEDLVAEHRPGDAPDDPPDPQIRNHVARFELAAETFALLRETRIVLDNEHGDHLTDDAFVAALCGAVQDGVSANEPSGRAKFQIAMTVCERCQQGWQEGGGLQVPLDAAAVERAECDAQHIGSIDGDAPERAHQDIPPSVARFVWRRDGGRCRVSGCRSARALELHHLVHRADGGSHEATNIVLVCGSHHVSHHRGVITISGTADQMTVHWPGAPRPSTTGLGAADAPMRAVAGAEACDDAQVTTSATGADTVNDRPVIVGAGGTRDVPPPTMRPLAPTAPRVADRSSAPTTMRVADTTTAPIAPRVADTTTALIASRIIAPTTPRSADRTGAHVGVRGASKLEVVVRCTEAKRALTGLGWKPTIAREAVDAASAALGPEATLERLIFEALRRCPRPA
jgi:hypothetical protein